MRHLYDQSAGIMARLGIDSLDINHNSDWSGPVFVFWRTAGESISKAAALCGRSLLCGIIEPLPVPARFDARNAEIPQAIASRVIALAVATDTFQQCFEAVEMLDIHAFARKVQP